MFNIFFLAFFAVLFAMGLAMVITRSKTPNDDPLVPPEDDFGHDQNLPAVTTEDLKKVARHLCQANGLTVKTEMQNTEHEIYWIAESQNEFFFGNYVLCLLTVSDKHRFATLSDLLEFKDFVKSATSTKGFFFTNGYFTRDVHQPLEGPKVALYNKKKILEELSALGPALSTT